jgi:hypothetical protein
MNFEDKTGIVGALKINILDRSGALKFSADFKNTVTVLGKAHIADRLSSNPSQDPMLAMAIGTGTPSSTALGSELKRKNVWSRTSSGKVVTYQGHWDYDDQFSGTITEAGIFNASSLGGTMLCSAVVSPSIVKPINDTLDITWNVTIT